MTDARSPGPTDPGPAATASSTSRAAAGTAGRPRRDAAAGGPLFAAIGRITVSASWRFGLAAAAAAALFGAVYGVFVLSLPGQRLENIALMGAQLRGAAAREESLTVLSQVTVLTFALALVGIAAIAFVRRRPGLGVLVAGVMGISTVVAELLKDVLPRPALVEGPIWILRNDFPSGTATVAAALGIGALLVSPDRLRWLVLPVGAIFAAIIGQSTQITGWHRMSGAIGGVLLVLAFASAALVVLARVGLVQPTSLGRVHPKLRAVILVLPAVALIVAVAALTLLVAFPLLQVPENADAVFLHTVFELLGFAFTIAAFVVFASVIEPYSFGRSGRPMAALAGGPPADGPPAAGPPGAGLRRGSDAPPTTDRHEND
ncbi:MAG TPA: phosphatase PAP2 family protein [Candidatus Limnocylindrales bacterium]|nr:phosphatase PAP2 family protein [Candidatus Limnocylindrales bacterium]